MSGSLQPLVGYGAAAYKISNSLRFRASASASLTKVITLSATWTLSVWLKRGTIGVASPIFGSSVGFNSNDTLTAGTLTTTAVYRDPSAWYHVVVSNSGCYVNGVLLGSVTTGILVNPAICNYLTSYFDGYIADFNLIDGLSLSAASFGQFDSTTGVWGPKQYTGSYGSAGFHLNFSNGTSTTTLGYDSSGNGNNWTTNNISLTAGSTYDWMIDSPTPYQGTSYGVGNYAVLNPLLLWYTNGSPFTLTNGNLSVSEPGATTWGSVASTIACPTSGKWYCEITPTAVGAAKFTFVGITNTTSPAGYPGQTSTSYAYQADGTKVNNGTATAYGAAYVANDIIGIAYDADSSALTFYKNGTSQGTAFTSITAGSYYFVVGDYATTQSSAFDANFGQRPFAYSPPSGYKSLCTYNLPSGTVTTSGSFTGNASSDGPFVWLNGVPTAMTINGNAVTFGTHADKTAGGFKLRTSSSSYNASGSNTYSITTNGGVFKNQDAQPNP